jgi:phosphate transport system permease protein
MPARRDNPTARVTSNVLFVVCTVASFAIVGVLVLITGYLVSIGFASINLDFFTRVATGDPDDPGGMKHAIIGTLMLLAMASVVGVPLGILAGVYLSEYADDGGRFNSAVRFTADVLAGLPSIVVGIVGYELLVVPMNKLFSIKYSGYAGAAALAFIMIPIVARTTEEMLRLVPGSYREASLGLGATKAQTILRVILPAATGSVITGIMLALARVAGETAPLLFTALGSRFLTMDPSQPFPSLTAQIYTYATGPYEKEKQMAWGGMLVLIAILFVLNLLIRYVAHRSVRKFQAS